mmetsp:Transcript_21457/g.52128  ORF Transcript_21457/g.52128 Transcript_21457/m.52128 type:complete len:100 (-) Transcript_21457:11-310(-)
MFTRLFVTIYVLGCADDMSPADEDAIFLLQHGVVFSSQPTLGTISSSPPAGKFQQVGYADASLLDLDEPPTRRTRRKGVGRAPEAPSTAEISERVTSLR